MDRYEMETRKLLKKHAKLVRTAGGHEIHKTADGGMLVVSCRGRKSKGAGHDFLKNALMQTRKAIERSQGIPAKVTGLVARAREGRVLQRDLHLEEALRASGKHKCGRCCGTNVKFHAFRERRVEVKGVRRFVVCSCGHEEEI